MLTPPHDLDTDDLLRELRAQYDVHSDDLRFHPLGEDSWSYHLGDLWVSVRRDLRIHLPAAYELSCRLRDAGLNFVLAPLPGADGRLVRRVGRHPVVVFPYVSAEPLAAETASSQEVAEAGRMLTRLHGCRIPADLPAEGYTLPFEEDVARVVAAADGAPDRGPYTSRLVRLLQANRHALAADRAELARLARVCAAVADPLVLTHGEPLASNILRTSAGLRLIDWGEAGWGPPERDFSHLARTLGVAPPQRPAFARLYEIRWRLSEIAEYGIRFLEEHRGDADDDAMWHRLLQYLPNSWQTTVRGRQRPAAGRGRLGERSE